MLGDTFRAENGERKHEDDLKLVLEEKLRVLNLASFFCSFGTPTYSFSYLLEELSELPAAR